MLLPRPAVGPLNSPCRGIAYACVVAGVVCSPRVQAQGSADRTTARSLAAEGDAALQARQYDTAEDRCRRADALVHAPTFVVARARALVGLGRLVEACECFSGKESPILAYTLLGVGGTGILVGTVAGIVAIDKRCTLDSVCVNGTCPQRAKSDLDAYHALGTTSGIVLWVGVAGAAAGVALLLTRPSPASGVRTLAGRVQLRAGVGVFSIQGVFQ